MPFNMTADQIKQIVSKYWTKKLWAVHYEVGLCKGGRLRADVLAISMGSQIVVIETKSSVADFRSDKKWPKYMPFSDRMYFAMTSDVYAKVKSAIPHGIGVFVVNPKTFGVKVRSRAYKREVDPAIRLNIVTRMAYRSADKTLYERKSKTSGARLVALTAVEAIQAMPRSERKGQKSHVVNRVTDAISRYV